MPRWTVLLLLPLTATCSRDSLSPLRGDLAVHALADLAWPAMDDLAPPPPDLSVAVAAPPAFALGAMIAVTGGPWGIVAEDFNEDGRVDIAVAGSKGTTVDILLNGGNGQFTVRSLNGGLELRHLVAADFDADTH